MTTHRRPFGPTEALKLTRKVIVFLHRWLSLLAGVLILIVTTTGALLVFHQEIYDWENPFLFDASPEINITLDQATATVLAAYPDSVATWLGTPEFNYDHGVYEIGVWTADEHEYWVYVDPGTGQILGAYEYEESLLHWLLQLHYALLLDDYFPDQAPGTIVVGVLGLVLLAMIVTGIVVWWPSLRNWALAFTVRWRGRRWYLRHYDLHKVIGILSVPILFVTTVTGISIELYDPFTELWYAAFPGVQNYPEELYSEPNGQAPLAYAELIASAEAAAPEGVTVNVIPAEDEVGVVYVALDAPFNPQWVDGYGNITVVLDQYTGAVLYVHDLRRVPLSQQIYEGWFWSLHIGNVGGWPTKILYFIFGLTPLVLAATGVTTWLMRRAAYGRRGRARQPVPRQPERTPAVAGD